MRATTAAMLRTSAHPARHGTARHGTARHGTASYLSQRKRPRMTIRFQDRQWTELACGAACRAAASRARSASRDRLRSSSRRSSPPQRPPPARTPCGARNAHVPRALPSHPARASCTHAMRRHACAPMRPAYAVAWARWLHGASVCAVLTYPAADTDASTAPSMRATGGRTCRVTACAGSATGPLPMAGSAPRGSASRITPGLRAHHGAQLCCCAVRAAALPLRQEDASLLTP